MSAIRPIRMSALAALLAMLAACASQTPTPHTSDKPVAGNAPASTSVGGLKGDAVHGKDLFMANCRTCHGVSKDDNSLTMVGPSLYGVLGRKAGTVRSLLGPSENLKNYGVNWSPETLDHFLSNPLAILAPDTAMAGVLKDPQERADVVAYLASLKK
jgi:cytochrome c